MDKFINVTTICENLESCYINVIDDLKTTKEYKNKLKKKIAENCSEGKQSFLYLYKKDKNLLFFIEDYLKNNYKIVNNTQFLTVIKQQNEKFNYDSRVYTYFTREIGERLLKLDNLRYEEIEMLKFCLEHLYLGIDYNIRFNATNSFKIKVYNQGLNEVITESQTTLLSNFDFIEYVEKMLDIRKEFIESCKQNILNVIEDLNGTWKPNFCNRDEYKYLIGYKSDDTICTDRLINKKLNLLEIIETNNKITEEGFYIRSEEIAEEVINKCSRELIIYLSNL